MLSRALRLFIFPFLSIIRRRVINVLVLEILPYDFLLDEVGLHISQNCYSLPRRNLSRTKLQNLIPPQATALTLPQYLSRKLINIRRTTAVVKSNALNRSSGHEIIQYAINTKKLNADITHINTLLNHLCRSLWPNKIGDHNAIVERKTSANRAVRPIVKPLP